MSRASRNNYRRLPLLSTGFQREAASFISLFQRGGSRRRSASITAAQATAEAAKETAMIAATTRRRQAMPVTLGRFAVRFCSGSGHFRP